MVTKSKTKVIKKSKPIANKKEYKKRNGILVPSQVDLHRIIPAEEGGQYVEGNVKIMNPVEHMKEHDIYRERPESMDKLKALVDDYSQLRKIKSKLENQLGANDRGVDRLDPHTRMYLNDMVGDTKRRLGKSGREIKKQLLSIDLPIINVALSMQGIGHISLAYLINYVDIHKAKHASSIWAYCGYHKASHERFQKGKRVEGVLKDGNKTLRTALFNLAGAFVRGKVTAYTSVYYQEKAKLEVSHKITRTRLPTKFGVHEMMWKDVSKGHRDGAARRKMIKHFLADFWFVWRTLEGLNTRPLYAEEVLGHTGIIKPQDRGWKF